MVRKIELFQNLVLRKEIGVEFSYACALEPFSPKKLLIIGLEGLWGREQELVLMVF